MPGGSCAQSANCSNFIGGYECTCPPNHNGTGYPGSPCFDLDECTLLALPCHHDAECINVPSSYECKCKTGFRGDALAGMAPGSPKGCLDIDECAEGTDTCRITQTCLNQAGSYYCRCNEGMIPYGEECFPPNYWQNNKAFLNRMGWHGPRSMQGLMRVMDLENFVRFSSSGFGWWMFLDGSLQAHHMLYSMGTVAPTHGAEVEWDPIQCYSAPASVVLDQSRGWIKQLHHMFRRKVDHVFVLAPLLNTSTTETQVVRIKFHELYLKPNDAIRICQESCQTLTSLDAQDLVQEGLELPATAGTLTFQTGGLREPFFDTEECADVPLWAGTIYLGQGRCTDITYAFAEQICVEENKDANGVSALDACCICGGGGSKGKTREFSIKNSYTARRYAMAASYHVGTQSLRDQNAADGFFAQQARDLEEEAATRRQQRPLKHKLSVANGIDAKLGFPECLEKRRITDYGSTIALEKGTSGGEPLIQGMWKGTCSPRPFGGGTKSCNVHLTVRDNAFEWSIDGCLGFSVNRFATGMLRQVHDDVKSVVDRYTNVASLRYKQIDVLYSDGAPAIVSDGSKVARGVFGWRDITLNAPKDEIVFSVNLPGDDYYPGEHSNGDFTLQMFPCQLSKLHRIHEKDLQIPLPRELQASESRIYMTAFELYQSCNESISRVEAQDAVCQGVLQGLIGTRVPLGGLSEEQLILAEEACANSCFVPFNASLHTAIDTCRRARVRFHEGAVNEPRLEAMDRFFTGRLVFLAETRTRVEATCTSNFMRKSCRRVMDILKSSDEPRCLAEATVADASLPIGADATLSFNIESSDRDGVQSECSAGCKQKFSSIAQNMHCCAASFYEAQSLWMDIVAPEQRHVSLDLNAYRCLYQTGFDCESAPTELVTLSREHLPANTPPEYPVRVQLDEQCESSSKQSLKCSFEVCDSDRLADGVTPAVLPWPKPCCLGFECLNGGTLPFSGACFCNCPTPFVRADCSEARLHLSFALALEGAEYHRFTLENAAAVLTSRLSVESTQIEVSFINVMEARRRRGAEIRRPAAAAAAAMAEIKEFFYPGHRRAISGLEVGFRVILDIERELTRVQEILNEAIAVGALRQPFADLGLGEATGYLQPPVIVRVGDTAAGSTDIGASSVDGTSDADASSDSLLTALPVTVIVTVVVSVFCAIGCCFACR